MPLNRFRRRAIALLGVSLLAALLAATLTSGPAQGAHRVVRVVPLHPGPPTNAGKIHRWGDSQWHYDFISKHLNKAWKVYNSAGNGGNGERRPSQVALQHGMLTINGTDTTRSGAVLLRNHGRKYGRWETRLRSKQYTTDGNAYHVVAALVPAGKQATHCGARDITFSDFDLGDRLARIKIHNLPNLEDYYGKHLNSYDWHDYAVEITKSHISWFVDGYSVMTDKRPAARSGIKLAVSFRLDANNPSGVNKGRMQMDWVRYYTLDRGRKVARDKHARPHHSTYASAC